MNPETNRRDEDDMRPEYDLRGGVRGKYYKQYMEGTNVVLLDADVAAVFGDSESVNQALRVLIEAAGKIEKAALRGDKRDQRQQPVPRRRSIHFGAIAAFRRR